MITLNMQLLPGGQGIGRTDVLSGTIWTTDDGKSHAYRLTDGEGIVHSGRIPKHQSGHRNPFDLLYNIAKECVK